MKKINLLLVSLFVLSTVALADMSAPSIADPEGSGCQGEDRKFETCQSNNCTDLISMQCSFIYGNDVLTSWGRKSKS